MNAYLVVDENDKEVDLNILSDFYGATWQSMMDRIGHSTNGYVTSFFYSDCKYSVYKKNYTDFFPFSPVAHRNGEKNGQNPDC